MEIFATLFSVSRSDPWAIRFFINYNENTLFCGESFKRGGVPAEESPRLMALVLSGHSYEKNYQLIVCHHQ